MKNETILGCLITASFLSGCGGGGGDTSVTNDTESGTYSITGYVLDGSVAAARVCFDVNVDNQCTSADEYVDTDNNGHFELTYSDSSYLNKYEVIADVRYSEASDNDYTTGSPGYDYVLKAFNTTNNSVVISPLSTYMNYQAVYGGNSEGDIISSTIETITSSEQYVYSATETITTTQYQTSLLGNYIQGENDTSESIANFNTRLHNINEVLARKMQESQAAWEDNFNNGDIEIGDNSWSSISNLVVSNANSTVFQGFDYIVEEVTGYDFSDFNAETVSNGLAVSLPTDDVIQSLLDYVEALDDVATEFDGTTYKHSYAYTWDTTVAFTGYYVFGSDGYSYYLDDGELCVYASAPVSGLADNISISQVIEGIDNAFESSSYVVNYNALTEYSAGPPSNCSSIYSALTDALEDDNIGTADTVDDEVTETTLVIPNNDIVKTAAAGVSSSAIVYSPSTKKTVGSISDNKFASGELNNCSSKGVMNSCSLSSK